MDHLQEKTVKTEEIFHGKMISVYLDHVVLPNGKMATREIVRHQGAVAVIGVTKDNRLIFVRQFRKPIDQVILEIPAGKLEKGEDPCAGAIRELAEETGYLAKEMKHVTSFFTSPGFADEKMHIYEAADLTLGESQPDEDEFVDLVELTLEESFDALKSGEIVDAKTVFAVYYWQNQILKAGQEK